ncbi:Long chain fatty acid CoA ligase 5 [Giardia muris]|uniref:Long chain fatty acid CoA ligase 5 n=1 Tax=Giardia muris TaxID=5742 RepID=A0A4Z1T5Q1_GIAMU|nr:Long chain fatty acid CoA ligase 5 [Giardia muris]|eukprot:TNJ27801.1 Long chain fatty acid CoA ligase 5 [Giardia muris]
MPLLGLGLDKGVDSGAEAAPLITSVNLLSCSHGPLTTGLLPNLQQSVLQNFRQACNQYSRRPFMFFRAGMSTITTRAASTEFKSLSYAKAQHILNHIAGVLRAVGVTRGDRVGILAHNSPLWLLADLAVMARGGITVPLFPSSGPDKLSHVIAHSGMCLLITQEQFVGKVLGVAHRCSSLRLLVSLDTLPAATAMLTTAMKVFRALEKATLASPMLEACIRSELDAEESTRRYFDELRKPKVSTADYLERSFGNCQWREGRVITHYAISNLTSKNVAPFPALINHVANRFEEGFSARCIDSQLLDISSYLRPHTYIIDNLDLQVNRVPSCNSFSSFATSDHYSLQEQRVLEHFSQEDPPLCITTLDLLLQKTREAPYQATDDVVPGVHEVSALYYKTVKTGDTSDSPETCESAVCVTHFAFLNAMFSLSLGTLPSIDRKGSTSVSTSKDTNAQDAFQPEQNTTDQPSFLSHLPLPLPFERLLEHTAYNLGHQIYYSCGVDLELFRDIILSRCTIFVGTAYHFLYIHRACLNVLHSLGMREEERAQKDTKKRVGRTLELMTNAVLYDAISDDQARAGPLGPQTRDLDVDITRSFIQTAMSRPATGMPSSNAFLPLAIPRTDTDPVTTRIATYYKAACTTLSRRTRNIPEALPDSKIRVIKKIYSQTSGSADAEHIAGQLKAIATTILKANGTLSSKLITQLRNLSYTSEILRMKATRTGTFFNIRLFGGRATHFISVGGPLSVSTASFFRDTFGGLSISFYGSTETLGIGLCTYYHDPLTHRGLLGRTMYGVQGVIKDVSERTEVSSTQERVGELCLKGLPFASAYFRGASNYLYLRSIILGVKATFSLADVATIKIIRRHTEMAHQVTANRGSPPTCSKSPFAALMSPSSIEGTPSSSDVSRMAMFLRSFDDSGHTEPTPSLRKSLILTPNSLSMTISDLRRSTPTVSQPSQLTSDMTLSLPCTAVSTAALATKAQTHTVMFDIVRDAEPVDSSSDSETSFLTAQVRHSPNKTIESATEHSSLAELRESAVSSGITRIDTPSLFDCDGYFHTGNLVQLLPDGRLVFVRAMHKVLTLSNLRIIDRELADGVIEALPFVTTSCLQLHRTLIGDETLIVILNCPSSALLDFYKSITSRSSMRKSTNRSQTLDAQSPFDISPTEVLQESLLAVPPPPLEHDEILSSRVASDDGHLKEEYESGDLGRFLSGVAAVPSSQLVVEATKVENAALGLIREALRGAGLPEYYIPRRAQFYIDKHMSLNRILYTHAGRKNYGAFDALFHAVQ